MKRSTVDLCAAGLCWAMLSAGMAQAQGMITVSPRTEQAEPGEPSERPVTYAQSQAASGRGAYDRYCVMCHGANLNDGEFGGPPLVGARFEESWGNLPVSVLYGYVEAAMPPDRPGGISDEARTDIIAYLLSRNGYPSGAALPPDLEAMDILMVEK